MLKPNHLISNVFHLHLYLPEHTVQKLRVFSNKYHRTFDPFLLLYSFCDHFFKM